MRTQLVTIGITCFNAASTIERALQSAFRQDWPNIEILIVDDASSDGSTAIIDGLIANRREARLIRHATNTGPAGARNTILAEAKGEFIVFLDDDDEALPGRVAGQVLCLEAYEKRSGAGLVACYASGTRVYCNGYRLDLPAIGSLGQAVPKGSGMVDFLLLYRRRPDWFYGTGTPSCSILARRSTFAAVGGFDSEFRRVEDADFAIRLALKGGHFIGTPQRLFIQHSTAAPDKAPERNLEAEQTLAVKYRDYLETVGGYYYALHWPRLRYWHFKHRYGRFVLELLGLFFRHPLAVTRHLLATGPRRLIHERRMRREDPT